MPAALTAVVPAGLGCLMASDAENSIGAETRSGMVSLGIADGK